MDLDEKKGLAKVAESPNLKFLRGDVSNPDLWKQALSLAEKEYGRVDVVVNNAGEQYQPLLSSTLSTNSASQV